MPMVSATDVPLQPFPTGRTSPQAPSDYQQIPTSPQMFGSIEGEALQKAGQEGEKLATEVAKVGAYEQHYRDLAEVDLLTANRDDKLNKEKYGDPGAGIDPATGKPLVPGIKNMLGNDALDYIKSGAPNKAFDDIVGSLANSASSERVRQMFLHQSRAQRAAYDNIIGEHWDQQLQQHRADVLKANDRNISVAITKGYNNDAELAANANQKIDLYTRGVTDPAIRAARYYQAVTEVAGDAIKAALGDNNPRRADELLNAYKDHMDGDAIAKLYPAVRHAMDELTIAEGVLGTGGRGAIIRAPEVETQIRTKATEAGVSPRLALTTASLESNFGRTPDRPGSEYQGVFQLGNAAAQSVGGRGIEHGVQSLANTREALDQRLGRAPADWEIYLAHNQGAAGAAALLANPGTPAGKLVPPENISGQTLFKGNPEAPASEFTAKVRDEFEKRAAALSGSGTVAQMQSGATRNLPIATTLNAQLERASTAVGDLKVEVFSGGQPSSGAGRVGSHRHDEGGAADIQLRDVQTGQLLDMRKPEDQARMAKFITAAVAAGATGVGAHPDYMGPNGIHIGGGAPAVWGSDQTSATAPGWLRSAYEAGRAGAGRTAATPAAPAPAPATAPAAATTRAAPAVVTFPPQREEPQAPVEVWGDSLGVGLKAQLKTEGTVVGGAQPAAILASIKAKPGGYWDGKTIVLSAGSNGNQMDKVEETIDHLQSRNATVVLVGYGPKFPEKNAKLREIATMYNARVIDAEDVAAGEGVHPSPRGYASMAGRIRALAAPSTVTVPGRPGTAPAAPPPGMKEPPTFELPPAAPPG